MWVPLTEVLALPSFRAARTVVLSGDVSSTQVRWVHSSEVFEMGSLLAGGEVLLTTGLGLHGRSQAHLREYVEQLADAQVAALAVELGRSFFEVPAPMIEAARARGMVLLTLDHVVPFERMAEDFHELLVRRKVGSSAKDADWHDLLHCVVEGLGLRALLDEISRGAGCQVEFVNIEGQVVERSRIASVAGDVATVAQVRGAGGVLGSVRLLGAETKRRRGQADRAALAVALEVGRRSGATAIQPGRAQSLISDLAAGVLVSTSEVARRFEEMGWRDLGGRHLWAVALECDPSVPLTDAIEAVQGSFGIEDGPVLAGVVGSDVVAVLRGWRREVPHRAREGLVAASQRLAEADGRLVDALIGVASPVRDAGDLPAAIAAARDVVRTARRCGHRRGVYLSRDVAAERLIETAVDPGVMNGFVTDQLGPLIDHDRQHRTELLRTLDAYLACSLSKVQAAELLGIRRQSLYDRLDRIERLLGISLSQPAHRTGLQVALLGWRMRTGLDPQVGFGS